MTATAGGMGAWNARYDELKILWFSRGCTINDNLHASREQSQTKFELCRGAAVNADISPNLPMPDRSLRGARVRLAA